jgi:hypothetical protein
VRGSRRRAEDPTPPRLTFQPSCTQATQKACLRGVRRPCGEDDAWPPTMHRFVQPSASVCPASMTRGREPSLADQIHLIGANRLGTEVCRRPTKVPSKPSDILDVRPLRVGERFRTCMSSSMRSRSGVIDAPLHNGLVHSRRARSVSRTADQIAEKPRCANNERKLALPATAKRFSPMLPIVHSPRWNRNGKELFYISPAAR